MGRILALPLEITLVAEIRALTKVLLNSANLLNISIFTTDVFDVLLLPLMDIVDTLLEETLLELLSKSSYTLVVATSLVLLPPAGQETEFELCDMGVTERRFFLALT